MHVNRRDLAEIRAVCVPAVLALVLAAGSASAEPVLSRTDPAVDVAGTAADAEAEPLCIEPGAAAASEAIQQPADEAPAYVMPSTGFAFTLPGEEEGGDSALPECPPPEPVRPEAPDIFGFSAVPIGAALRGDWDAEKAVALEGAQGQWRALLIRAGMPAARDPVDQVNRWVNRHLRYVDDRYGDQWSDAADTLSRGYGDCEDYAIAKMALLSQLGVPRDSMFLVLLKERTRPGDHAVLAVRQGGQVLVLDNRTDTVRHSHDVSEYVPTLSYSGPFAWTYGLPASARQRSWGSPLTGSGH